MKDSYTVTFGGWYQRTTLHLSEVYDFLAHGTSALKQLDSAKLRELRDGLGIESVTRETGYLESVVAKTHLGITIRYYEDGLYVLEKEAEDIAMAHTELEQYFEQHFNPATSYLFSLGAPTPKLLANIKTTHPTVVSVLEEAGSPFTPDPAFGEVYTRVSSNGVTVFKTPQYIFIASSKESPVSLMNLVEMQIFFREFKDQLEKYLSIHRTIWEEISDIKEGETITGKRVEEVRGKLDSYEKTISLISNRINQMGSYAATRSSLARHLSLQDELVTLFEYKFETLTDTLSYIKEIWQMTKEYLASAIQNLVEIKSQATSNNLQSLQTITSIGVISGVLGYLSATKLPTISMPGVFYFILLFLLTLILNTSIRALYKNKKYSLKFGHKASDI